LLALISFLQSEARFRALIEEAPVATCLFVGEEMRIEVANDIMLRYWGKPASIIGLPLEEALPELKGQPFLDILSNVLSTGKTYISKATGVELKVNDVLGTYYFDFTYKPLFDTNGKAYGIMDMAVDVTDQVLARHKIEEVVALRTKELAEANLLLKQNNRELEQFAYVASHDLQEPLRKVSTFTEMLKKHLGEVDEKSLNLFNKISSSTLRMVQLIHDVLDFSKLSNQHQVFEKVDMNALINHLMSDFELVVEQKGAIVNYGNLPILNANPLQMRQLFGNLLSNSLKFTKERITPVISISSHLLSNEEKALHKELLPEVNYCIITVEDNGIGFSEEHADKIFKIFQRLHGRSEFAGTGIGLALCKKIAQNHHGEIWATSQEGVGATFHIILPCQQDTDS
jgi:signal transduction histidine kinase